MESPLQDKKASNSLKYSDGLTILEIWPIFLVTILIAIYFVTRYAGQWTENDTASMTVATRNISGSSQLIPDGGFLYDNGYAYQVIVIFLGQISGLEIASLQQLVLPFGIVLLAVPTCLLLFEITGSRAAAVYGAILLFTQPEFLFVVLRGNHEKFGRLFMILALFLLFRSFKSHQNFRRFAVYIVLFYLAVYGLLASNFLIGFSFIVALAFGLLMGTLLSLLIKSSNGMVTTTTRRLAISVLVCFVLSFLLAFYFYPPVQHNILLIDGMVDRLRVMMLETETTNVYQGVLFAWINPFVYALINLANWLTLLLSFPVWLWYGLNWLVRKQSPHSQAVWLLWLLYGAFGFQAALAILSDASGMFGNLQHRLFPSFALLSVALLTDTFSRQASRLPRKRFTKFALGGLVFLLTAFGLIKSTNEASLVSWWTFYAEPELHATQWFDRSSHQAALWAGFTARLPEAIRLVQGGFTADNWIYYGIDDDPKPNFLVSDLIEQQSLFVRQQLPDTIRELRIYDNGSTHIYHRRPRTPYQR